MEKGYPLYPLTQPQQRVWVTQMIYSDSPMFVIGGYSVITGDIDEVLLREAILSFTKAHDTFRLRLTRNNEVPVQYYAEDSCEDVGFIDFFGTEQPEEALKMWVQDQLKPFVLENSPLYSFTVFRLDSQTCGYFGKFHHMISDGWSMQIISREIKRRYALLHEGEIVQESSDSSYRSFLQSERDYLGSAKFHKDRIYWKEQFRGLLPEGAAASNGLEGRRKTHVLSESLTRQLYELCTRNSLSVNALFIGMYLLYLYKISGNEELVVGIPVYGRSGKKERAVLGMCVSSIPFRFTIEREDTLVEMVRRIDVCLKRSYKHQKFPYNYLLNELDASQLYTTSINYYNTQMEDSFNGCKTEYTEFYNGEQEYALQLIVRDWNGSCGIQLDVDYQLAVYTDIQIDRLISGICVIMNSILDNEGNNVSDLSLVNEQDRSLLVTEYNNTLCKFPEQTSVIDLFDIQARQTPARVAIYCRSENITFQELAEKASRVAVMLQSRGITEGSVVGLLFEHSIEMIAGILGILKLGAAYLPIDPKCPSERLAYMLRDSEVQVVLTNMELASDLKADVEVIRLDNRSLYSDGLAAYPPKVCYDPHRLVYIIYTSGSSGEPKGVMIEDHSLFNYIWWAKNEYISKEHEVFPLYSSVSFDLTVTSIFLPLISGGGIRIYSDSGGSNPIQEIAAENVCSIAKLTPAHLMLLADIDNSKSNIEALIIGGDNLSVDLVERVRKSFGKDIAIYNEYGPTEATVGCMIYRYKPVRGQEGSVPIGTPIANTQIFVLDKHLQPVPVGIEGRLYISGEGLARGYLNRPELTADRFIEGNALSGRLYDTGDIAKFINYQCVEYIGRCDDQVKINGYRIELHEIDLWLNAYPHLKWAKAAPIPVGSSLLLTAYYMSSIDIDEGLLRGYLATKLPSYSIPAIYIRIDEVPLTKNGKINLAALPVPPRAVTATTADEEPQEAEKALLEVVASVIGTEVQAGHNFYYLGGDSIKAIQVSSYLSDKGYRLKVKDILEHPVLKDMATYVETVKDTRTQQALIDGAMPLPPIANWFIARINERPNEYCQSIKLNLKRRWDINPLQQILHEIVLQHDSLRLNYDAASKTLFYNRSCKEQAEIVEIDVTNLRGEARKDAIQKEKTRLASTIDISNGLLLRSCIFRDDQAEDIWLLMVHHLGVDGVSWRIILQHIHTLMEQVNAHQSYRLPAKGSSYRDWVEYWHSRKSGFDEETEYWSRSLKPRLPSIPFNACAKPGGSVLIHRELDSDTTAQLRKDANVPYNTSVDELLIAALSMTLKEAVNPEELIFELESHGRGIELDNIDITNTVGWFTHMYPVVFEIQQDQESLGQLIRSVKETMRKVPNQGIGYGHCKVWDDKDSIEKLWIRFNYLGEFMHDNACFGVTLDEDVLHGYVTCLLEINCFIQNGKLVMYAKYSEDVLETKFICTIMEQWQCWIEKVVRFCIQNQGFTFSPSDFIDADLSQDELDLLFGETSAKGVSLI